MSGGRKGAERAGIWAVGGVKRKCVVEWWNCSECELGHCTGREDACVCMYVARGVVVDKR